jgi:CubicO group peptidase (beta-lactamase class C family)
VRPIIAFFALALAGCTAAGQPPALIAPVASPRPPARAPLPAELGTWIDAFASSFGSSWGDAFRFNGLIVLARDGEVVFQKAYGKANVASGAVAGLDTRFRVGSITKQFTATSVLSPSTPRCEGRCLSSLQLMTRSRSITF